MSNAGSGLEFTRSDLMRFEKAAYQQGDFNKLDITGTGDTMGALFLRNYGYAPTPAELVQYGNYNFLSDAHDVSVNREIISPSLDELHLTSFTSEQLKSFSDKDAAFALQRQARLAAREEAAAEPVWSFREASMAQRKLDEAMADAGAVNYAPTTVSPTYKAVSSAIGMVADALGMVAAGAMTVTGVGLTLAP